jgi:hypothetical protein
MGSKYRGLLIYEILNIRQVNEVRSFLFQFNEIFILFIIYNKYILFDAFLSSMLLEN